MITEKQIGAWAYGLLKASQLPESNRYVGAVLQKGGLEGWAQVELAQTFESLPGCQTVQREQHIYENRDWAVDFQVDTLDEGQFHSMFVELKCESLFQSADLGRVVLPHKQYQLVESDYEKLWTQRRSQFKNESACVLAIVFSEEARKGLDGWLAGLLKDDPEIRQTYDALHGRETWRLYVYSIPVHRSAG